MIAGTAKKETDLEQATGWIDRAKTTGPLTASAKVVLAELRRVEDEALRGRQRLGLLERLNEKLAGDLNTARTQLEATIGEWISDLHKAGKDPAA